MLRRFRRALLILAVLLVAGLTALVAIATVYEEQVKAALIGALNERLMVPVKVADVELTLIKRFPKASIRMRQVQVDEVRTDGAPPDTLLAAQDLYLEFDIWGLFRQDYTVDRIHGQGVRLGLGLDANGAENYLIWRTDSAAAGSEGAPIDLRTVSFDGLALRYRDARDGLVVRAASRALEMSGRLGAAENEARVLGDLRLEGIERRGEQLLDTREAQLALRMRFGEGAFRITEGEVTVGKVPLQVALAVTPGARGKEIDLRANGLGLDLGRAVMQLPEFLRAGLARFSMEGDLDLAVRYAGALDGDGPALSVGAQVSRGRLKDRSGAMALTDLFGEISIEVSPQGRIRQLRITDLRARSGSGSLHADWASGGLANAPLKAALRCDMRLADLLRLAGVDTLEQAAGRFVADLKAEGTLRDMADVRVQDLRTVRITGHAALHGAALKLKGVRHRVEHLDAEMALAGNDATVRGLRAELAGSPIELSGTLRNLVPFVLFDDQRLSIEAKGRSERLDLAALLQSDAPKTGDSDYALVLPATIDLDLRAQVDELAFEDFRATGINGTIRMKDRVLRAAPVTFGTAGGAVLGSLELDARGGERAAFYPLAIDAQVKDIDVKELFREFQDFGQGFIGHRHLSGKARASIAFRAPLSPALQLDRERIESTIDIAVDQGAIKGQEQLMAVADYLRGNKLVAPFVDTGELRRRLGDVRFAKLENRIEIRDGAVHVPLMDVRSNALDIELTGTHWFDDRIDHRLNFRLSDLFRLGRPAKDEFGPIADDGTGMRVFLRMRGTARQPVFENDGAMAADKRRQQFQQEKQELRAILREDILGKKPGQLAQKQPEGAPRRITIEADSAAAPALVQEKPRKGAGRLFREEKKEEGGRVTVEE